MDAPGESVEYVMNNKVNQIRRIESVNNIRIESNNLATKQHRGQME